MTKRKEEAVDEFRLPNSGELYMKGLNTVGTGQKGWAQYGKECFAYFALNGIEQETGRRSGRSGQGKTGKSGGK